MNSFSPHASSKRQRTGFMLLYHGFTVDKNCHKFCCSPPHSSNEFSAQLTAILPVESHLWELLAPRMPAGGTWKSDNCSCRKRHGLSPMRSDDLNFGWMVCFCNFRPLQAKTNSASCLWCFKPALASGPPACHTPSGRRRIAGCVRCVHALHVQQQAFRPEAFSTRTSTRQVEIVL